MKILLARIDDRLIHGQVTVGWSQQLRPDRIILASNEIAADPWQSRVYSSSVPPEITVTILGTSQTAALLAGAGRSSPEETAILLAGHPADMYFLFRHGLGLAEINVGGMHFVGGKLEMLPFVYVDRRDLAVFRSFLAAGARLSARQVPGGRETVIDLAMIQQMEARL